VSADLVVLAALMMLVTYPSRAVPLLAPGVDRLPPQALLYLRLVGPAMLASLAAASVLVLQEPDGGYALHVGVDALGVLVCVALVAWRRNLFLGLSAGVLVVAVLRLAGWG
jgi:branched-subunit amino acid transport protein